MLSIKEKVGYALGDTASNFYWAVFSTYLFIFYTDIFGIPAAAVGTMMLVTRLIDAFTDPMMGALADRTQTRFGKFRPYLLWGIIPIAAAGVLTFTVPDVDDSQKLIYAYATYIFMMLAYTFINVPYGALLGVMTANTQQRTTLTSFRFIVSRCDALMAAMAGCENRRLKQNGHQEHDPHSPGPPKQRF